MSFENLGLEQQEALTLTKLRDIKKKINEESWSDNMENLMKQWGEKSAGLRFIHNNSRKIWKNFGDRLSILGIVITGLSSALSLASTSIGTEETKNEMLFAIGGIGFLSTLIQALKKFYNSEEKAADHASSAKQFGSFYRYMTLQMNMSRADREPADVLTAWALKEYERLQNEAPSLDSKSIQLFKDKFDSKQQALPDIAEDKFIIKIVKDNDDEVKIVESKEIQVSMNNILDLSYNNINDISNNTV